MSLFYLVQSPKEAGDERRAPREIGPEDMFVQRVRTIAHWPKAI
jgi:hypothetical protein